MASEDAVYQHDTASIQLILTSEREYTLAFILFILFWKLFFFHKSIHRIWFTGSKDFVLRYPKAILCLYHILQWSISTSPV